MPSAYGEGDEKALQSRRRTSKSATPQDGSAQEPRVLDGDDGLSGKVSHQFNMFIAEGPDFLPVDADYSYRLVLLSIRTTKRVRALTHRFVARHLRQGVRNVDHLFAAPAHSHIWRCRSL